MMSKLSRCVFWMVFAVLAPGLARAQILVNTFDSYFVPDLAPTDALIAGAGGIRVAPLAREERAH